LLRKVKDKNAHWGSVAEPELMEPQPELMEPQPELMEPQQLGKLFK
jgi:hypothetical protein